MFVKKKNKYYTFDDENREILFHRYDAPTPWINYLTNGEFFTMISQAGGNLSWYKSPEIWRIGRYPFFNVPTDGNGLFVYIKDLETNLTWNPNFLPFKTKLDSFESRHGLGYTKFISTKDGVDAKLIYYVGEDNALICKLTLKSNKDKKIQIFTAKEMGNMEFLREAQWECYTRNSQNISYKKDLDCLVYNYFIDCQNKPEETPDVFFTSTQQCSSYTASRKDFLGIYRDFRDPISIEKGECPNTELLGGEGIFANSYDISLEKDKEFKICFILGTIPHGTNYKETVSKFKNIDYCDQQFALLNKKWDEKLSKFQVKTSNKDLDRMVNIWNPYQVYNVFYVCREISFYATGTVRGMGVRDTSQDTLSNILFSPKDSKERILDILKEQYKSGKTNNYYYHIEGKPSLTDVKSDNHLWFIFDVYEYVMETGDLSILDEVVPYYDGGEGSILEHMEASIDFSMSHLGTHDIPLMLGSDWNDCLNSVCKKGQGESVMVAEQVVLAAKHMKELYLLINKNSSKLDKIIKKEEKVINDTFYVDTHFARCTTDSGIIIGKPTDKYGRVWINSNTWAVLANVSSKDRLNSAMDQVMKNLNSDVGLVKLAPALVPLYPSKEEEISWATPGIGENGGVFCHANTWAIIALAMLGRGNEAFEIYDKLIPDHVIDKVGVERYLCEPYAYCSNIRALYADRGGEAAVSWVTGTSTWMYNAVTQYIFGVKPKFDGIEINPVLPDSIKEANVVRKFKNTTFKIHIVNEKSGNTTLFVDGKKVNNLCVKADKPLIEIECVL